MMMIHYTLRVTIKCKRSNYAKSTKFHRIVQYNTQLQYADGSQKLKLLSFCINAVMCLPLNNCIQCLIDHFPSFN